MHYSYSKPGSQSTGTYVRNRGRTTPSPLYSAAKQRAAILTSESRSKEGRMNPHFCRAHPASGNCHLERVSIDWTVKRLQPEKEWTFLQCWSAVRTSTVTDEGSHLVSGSDGVCSGL